MNSSNEMKFVGEGGVLSKKVSTEKQFNMNGVVWQYENNFALQILEEEGSGKLKINNFLCEMTGNSIKKVTQIIFKNRKFTIRDNYVLQLPIEQNKMLENQAIRQQKDGVSTNESDDKNQSKDKSDEKKIYIFKKKGKKQENPLQPQNSRNTKNITKNFCKAFLVYLKSGKPTMFQEQVVREGISIYSKLLEYKKYNNRLIKKIIGNEILRELFKVFLQSEAKNWINESRVSDKELHYEAISIYLNLFERYQFTKSCKDDLSESEQSQSEHLLPINNRSEHFFKSDQYSQ